MTNVAIELMIVTIISKLTGLAREIVFSQVYGTSMVKDIYVISMTMIALSFSFLFMSIQSTFIPIYHNELNRGQRRHADLFTANLTNSLLLVATLVVIFFEIFMGPILKIVAHGFTGEKYQLAVVFCRITILAIYFSAINGPMIAYLQIYGDFLTPATTGIIMNMVLIVFAIFASRKNSLWLLAGGVLFAHGIQYLFFPRALRKAGYRHRLFLNLRDPYLKESLAIALPAMISIVVNDLSIIVDKAVATTVAASGGVSALDYAAKLYDLIQGIVIVSIVTAAFPKMTALAREKKMSEVKRISAQSITAGLILIIPAVFGLMAFSTPVVRAFYERGAFTSESTAMTAGILFFYAPALIFVMFYQMNTRIYYTMNNTKTPLFIATIQVILNIILNLILSRFFGLNGLSAATTITAGIGAVLMVLTLRKKVGALHYRGVFRSLLKITAASVLMIFCGRKVYDLLPGLGEISRMLLVLLSCALVYFPLVGILRVPELSIVAQSFQRRFGKNRALK